MSFGSSGRVSKYRNPPIAPGNQLRRHRSIRAIRAFLGSPQDLLKIAELHLPALARRDLDEGGIGDRQFAWCDVNEIILDLPVAQGPEDLVGHEDCAGRGLREPVRVERDEPRLPLRVVHGESGRKPGFLGSRHRPRSRRWAVAGQRASHHIGGRQFVDANAVREPARIGHFIDGIDVARLHDRCSRTGIGEEVLAEIPQQIEFPLLDLRRILRVGLTLKRIVAVELDRRAAGCRGLQKDTAAIATSVPVVRRCGVVMWFRLRMQRSR